MMKLEFPLFFQFLGGFGHRLRGIVRNIFVVHFQFGLLISVHWLLLTNTMVNMIGGVRGCILKNGPTVSRYHSHNSY